METEYDEEQQQQQQQQQQEDDEQQEQHHHHSPLFHLDSCISLSDVESLQQPQQQQQPHDHHQHHHHQVVVVTPRTQRVFRHLGIKAAHLRDPDREQVLREMRRHHEDKNLVGDADAVQMRLQFKLDTQRRLLAQALRLYQSLTQQGGGGGGGSAATPPPHGGAASPSSPMSAGGGAAGASTTSSSRPRSALDSSRRMAQHFRPVDDENDDDDAELEEAMRNAEHLKQANLRRLEQTLLKREIVRFKHEKMRDERAKELALEREKQARLRARERETAAAQAELQLQREAEQRAIREARQSEMLGRRAEFEARTRELDFRWNARRRRAMEENRKRHELNELRRAAQMENASQSLQRKRATQEQSQVVSELLLERRRAEQFDATRGALEANAEKARYRLAEVRARGEALQDARQEKLKEREAQQQAVAEAQNRQRALETEQRRAAEARKAERRTRALAQAAKSAAQSREKFAKAVGAYEGRAEARREMREREQLLRKERMREVEIGFELFKERQGASTRAQREELEERVLEKNARVQALAQRREKRRVRRLMIRQEAEKTRIHEADALPGPGEYDVASTIGASANSAGAATVVGAGSPAFSFGMPFSSQGARQIEKHTACANYEASPGPAVYAPSRAGVARHKKVAIIGRTPRWQLPDAHRNPTPGPGAYHSPSKLDELSEEQLESILMGSDGGGMQLNFSAASDASHSPSRGGGGGGGAGGDVTAGGEGGEEGADDAAASSPSVSPMSASGNPSPADR